MDSAFDVEASALKGHLRAPEPIRELSRAVNASEWSEMVGQGQATATIRNSLRGEKPNYYTHPAVIDTVFQLLPVAFLLGLGWRLGLKIVDSIGDISATCCSSDVTTSVTGRLIGSGSIVGSSECMFNAMSRRCCACLRRLSVCLDNSAAPAHLLRRGTVGLPMLTLPAAGNSSIRFHRFISRLGSCDLF